MGSPVPQQVQAQQCWIDKIHNPNASTANQNQGIVNVTLTENGVVKYSNALGPGTTEELGFRFYSECVLTTDGLPVTIHGRIRA